MLSFIMLLGMLQSPIFASDSNTTTPTQPMKLFVLPGCPSCYKVMRLLQINNIHKDKVILVRANIQQPLLMKLIYQYTGIENSTQVPFLYNPNVPMGMLESDEIMVYLTKVLDLKIQDSNL